MFFISIKSIKLFSIKLYYFNIKYVRYQYFCGKFPLEFALLELPYRRQNAQSRAAVTAGAEDLI